MTESLRLEAAVVDRFSKPLKDLRDRLNGIKSPAGVAGMTRDFEKMQHAVKNAAREVGNSLSMSLLGVGASAVGVAGAIEGIKRALAGFAQSAIDMRTLSKETGISISAIQALQAAAGRFNIPVDAMRQGLAEFGKNIHEIGKQKPGTVYDLLLASPLTAAGLTEKLVAAAKSGDMTRALDIAIDFIIKERKGNPRNAEKIAEMLFGTGNIARLGDLGVDKFREAMKEISGNLRELTGDDLARAQAFTESMSKLSDSFERLKMTAGTEFAPAVTDFLEKLDRYLNENKDGLVGGLRAVGDAMMYLGGALKFIQELDEAERKRPGVGAVELLGRRALGIPDTKLEALKKSREDIDGQIKLGEEQNWPAQEMLMLRNSRRDIDEQIRKLEEAVKKGTSEGLKDAIEKMGYRRGGFGDATFQHASLGGGGSTMSRAARGGMSAARGAVQEGSSQAEDGATRSLFGSPGPEGNARGSMGQRGMYVMRRLINMGWTPEAAAAAVGNFEQESGIRSDGASGDGGTAHGMAQWRLDRFEALKRFAAKRGTHWRDMDTQIDFFNHEVGTRGQGAMRTRRDMATANHDMYKYERYGHIASYGTRLAMARKYHRMWQQQAGRMPAAADGPMRQAPDVGLWAAAKGAGVVGPGVGNIGPGGGTARLDVTMTGFPKGTRVNADGGGLFKETNIERGRSMVAAPGSDT